MARHLVVEADGGSRGNPGPAGYGALVRDAASGAVLAERADYLGVTSNNVAEYSGLVAGLRAARGLDPDAAIEVRMDSRLVVEQMSGRWQIKHDDMRRLAGEARSVAAGADVTYTWVPREQNRAADALANEAMDLRLPVARDGSADADTTASHGAAAVSAAAGPGAAGSCAEAASGPTSAQDAPGTAASGTTSEPGEAEPLTLILVRHGETPMTVTKAYSGSSVVGPSLTDRGRQQAVRAAALVQSVVEDDWGKVPPASDLLASPMTRAQETAAAVAERLGLPVRTEPLVAECNFGAWEGLTADEIERGWPGDLDRWHDDASVKAPGGESIEDVGERMRTVLERLRRGGVGRTVVLVTHSVAVRAAVGVAIGANSAAWARIRVAPASVSIIRLFTTGKSEVTVVGAPSGA